MQIETARQNMILQQARAWGVLDQPTLDLLQEIPREQFVPKAYHQLAFADTAIPLGHDQKMLTPKEEARIMQALDIQSSERIFEIGTGSGYFTALLAQRAKHVESIDIFDDFVEAAKQKLNALNIRNIHIQTADVFSSHLKKNSFDVIVFTGSLPALPKSFAAQLTIGGRLFAICGEAPMMQAILFTRVADNTWQHQVLFETLVTPLVNAPHPNAFIF